MALLAGHLSVLKTDYSSCHQTPPAQGPPKGGHSARAWPWGAHRYSSGQIWGALPVKENAGGTHVYTADFLYPCKVLQSAISTVFENADPVFLANFGGWVPASSGHYLFISQSTHNLLYVFLFKDRNLIYSIDSLCTHGQQRCHSRLKEAYPAHISSVSPIAAFLGSETLDTLRLQAGVILHRESPAKPTKCQTRDTK